MADDKLFRKAALDKLASPERLDVLMQVTKPADWIAKLTILGLALAGLAWGFFGSIPGRVAGQGQLRGGGGIQTIQAGGSGVLSEFNLVATGGVTVGQKVAVISTAGGDVGLEAATAELREAQRLLAEARASAAGTIGDLESQRQIAQGSYATEEAAYKQKKPLVDDQLLPPTALRPHEDAMRRLKSQMSDLGIQIGQQRQNVQQAESRVRQADINLKKILSTNKVVEEVTSALTGRVVALNKQQGDPVNQGDVLAEIETKAEGVALEVRAYTPASAGRPMQVGQAVQITVAGIKREENGFLKGTVTYVSPAPVSASEAAQMIKDTLGESALYEVRIAPTLDAATPSGYAWSTGEGPVQQLTGGIPVQVAIEIGDRAPISLLIPYLRGMFGG
jgi:HlyD family secretion protein